MPLINEDCEITGTIAAFADQLETAITREINLIGSLLPDTALEEHTRLKSIKGAVAIMTGGGEGCAQVVPRLTPEHAATLVGNLVCIAAMLGLDYQNIAGMEAPGAERN